MKDVDLVMASHHLTWDEREIGYACILLQEFIGGATP